MSMYVYMEKIGVPIKKWTNERFLRRPESNQYALQTGDESSPAASGGGGGQAGEIETLTAKFHFVDLVPILWISISCWKASGQILIIEYGQSVVQKIADKNSSWN
jgi:hypothetical protein